MPSHTGQSSNRRSARHPAPITAGAPSSSLPPVPSASAPDSKVPPAPAAASPQPSGSSRARAGAGRVTLSPSGAAPSRVRPARGPPRAVPCLGCVRSALHGKSTGECFDTVGRSQRCWRCASGHTCEDLPSYHPTLPRAARALIRARVADDDRRIKKYRAVVGALLVEFSDDENEDGTIAAAPPPPAAPATSVSLTDERRKDLLNALEGVVDALFK